MGDVVDDVHVQLVGRLLERLRKRLQSAEMRVAMGSRGRRVALMLIKSAPYLASQERHHRPVDPCVVGSSGHGLEVVLALGRPDASTRKLA